MTEDPTNETRRREQAALSRAAALLSAMPDLWLVIDAEGRSERIDGIVMSCHTRATAARGTTEKKAQRQPIRLPT